MKTPTHIALAFASLTLLSPACSADGNSFGGGYDDSGGWSEPGGNAGPGPSEPPPISATPVGGATEDGASNGSPPGEVRVRKHFPETLLVEPALFTDAEGRAELGVDLADSITRWRVSTQASSADGRLGSSSHGLTVFQDFFIDIDFPPTLTRGDTVTFPIAVFNYLDTPQTLTLDLTPAPWFTLLGPATEVVTVEPGATASVHIPVRVERVGTHALTVTARGDKRSDAVRRSVRVLPDGQEVASSVSAPFEPDDLGRQTLHHIVEVPEGAVPHASNLRFSVRPGLAAEVIAGMDSLLRLPGATCFEVTTSAAWPNALILGYLEATGSVSPEVETKARDFVSKGYQRILSFEIPSGGFHWWAGNPIGNPMLSAMGIMMLADTRAVHPSVDDRVLDRTADWLFAVQASDGSWPEDHIKSSADLADGSLRATCFTTWGLAHGGFAEASGTQRALDLIERAAPEADDTYTDALCANALAVSGRDGAVLDQLLARLAESALRDGGATHWTASDPTLVGSQESGAHVEVSALAALAFVHAERQPDLVQSTVHWLMQARDAGGNWGHSSQASVLALKLFLAVALQGTHGKETDATVALRVDGEVVAERAFDAFNKDVLWSVPVGPLSAGKHRVQIDFSGAGALAYQLVDTHHIPWGDADPRAHEAVTLRVDVPGRELVVGEAITLTTWLTPLLDVGQGMYAIALTLPPGFVLDRDPLDQAIKAMWISSYELRGSQLYIYIDEHNPGTERMTRITLTPTLPGEVQLGPFQAFEYYNREVTTEVEPLTLTVTER